MDHRHLAAEARQEQRLFHRRVAAADDDDVLVAEERAVARRARRHAAPAQPRLAGDVQPARARAGRDDHAVGGVLVLGGAHDERPLGEVDLGDVDVVDHRAEPLGLRAKRLHQLGPHDPVREAGVVLDLGGEHELPAVHVAGEDDRGEVRAGGVDGGGQAGRAGADDDDLGVGGGGHCALFNPGRVASGSRTEVYRRCSKLVLEILISAILHPVAVVLMWLNLAGRSDLTRPRRSSGRSSGSSGGSAPCSTSSSATARSGSEVALRLRDETGAAVGFALRDALVEPRRRWRRPRRAVRPAPQRSVLDAMRAIQLQAAAHAHVSGGSPAPHELGGI